MIEHSNLEDYADPARYDLENGDFEPDGPFYLALARQTGGPVLDLGCGTGRIAIPLAEAGFAVTGVDTVHGMVARARVKAGQRVVDWIVADARRLALGRRFRLVLMPGAVFAHCLAEQDTQAVLDTVRAHLTPDGIVAFDLPNPHSALYEDAPEEQHWYTLHDDTGRELDVGGTNRFDHDAGVYHETTIRRWRDAAGDDIVVATVAGGH